VQHARTHPALFAPSLRLRAREIYPGIDTLDISPEAALREYGLMKLRFARLYAMVFENEMMRRLLRMIPA